jgi:hypothetical protein
MIKLNPSNCDSLVWKISICLSVLFLIFFALLVFCMAIGLVPHSDLVLRTAVSIILLAIIFGLTAMFLDLLKF